MTTRDHQGRSGPPSRLRTAWNCIAPPWPYDRVHYVCSLLLLLVLVVGSPLAGWAAGSTAYDHSLHETRARSAGRHLVTAHLTADTKRVVPGAAPGGAVGSAPVRWTDRSGSHTGVVAATENQKKGSRVLIWVDRSEKATPVNSAEVQPGLLTGSVVGVATGAGAAALAGGARAGLWRWHDRQCGVRWEKEWAEVEPRWSHRSEP